ncbi:TonB-dependent receptor plug domain-containing protein [Dyadobacter flavalbus]|uniref:TonB-dependent receptor plug domain-containing protein n=1 Tax=Dyadobacter flavalbus TaxID=2579942 RepID=A0A5M8QTP1_9BACT|nr:TonB-dependent receptor plug domain-containing protein [Dyadobacter flavalbus]KAA6439627.1 TonB-dependent receptor plug domain-containing protein [Dyadobacter flavalbus]
MQLTRYLQKSMLVAALLMALMALKWADEDFTRQITSKLQLYRHQFPYEKAYLHTDKPYYVTGDTLWFKGYLVDGSMHLPDSASNLLYVDFIEQQTGKNVALRRVQMSGGIGHGEITLDSLPAGAYTIRAYTNWMRNFSDVFFFQKSIHLFDTESTTANASSDLTDVQFFPEGGQLVAGINTRVAFKAVNGNGLGTDVKGFVLNRNNDTVSSFNSEYLGMGRFQFEPRSGERYTAFIRTKDEKATRFNFPEVQENGFTLLVDNLSNPLKMRIIAYCKTPEKKEVPVHIVGHSRGIISFAARGVISGKGLTVSLPTAELPDGITHLTLFDDQNKPVCERLVFINHQRSLNLKVNLSKTAFAPREQTEIEIVATDSAGKPAEANLSVAVTDAGQIKQQPYDANIVSYLLLSSDLKGFIEQPGYYFDPEKKQRKIHADYLMMTQGWSRFRWEDVLRDSLEAPGRFLEQGITLTGEVLRNDKPVNSKIMLSLFLSNDSLSNFLSTETNENGKFAVYNLVFADSLQIRLQGMNKKGNQNLSFILNPFDPPKMTLLQVPFYPVTVEAQKFKDFLKRAGEEQELTRKIRENRERLLKEVTIKAKKEAPRDSRKLYNTADATVKITPQLASGNMSVLDMLAGRVAGVQVSGSGMNASVFIRGNRGEPLFVLDGMPVDKAMITNLNVFDVESIDVLKGASAAIFGSRGGNGVISVLTKRGNANYDYSQDIVPGVLVSKIAGFNVPKEFYAPAYAVKKPDNLLPDFRSTIHWAPVLKTDKNGKVKFQYYNTDAATSVDVRVEALSPSGIQGTANAGYTVQ